MFNTRKEEQLSELQHNNRISAILQAIPGAPAPNASWVEFEQEKDALMTKLTTDIAFKSSQGGHDEYYHPDW